MYDIPVPVQLVMSETERLPRWYSESLPLSSSSNEVTATDISTTHTNDPSPMEEASAPKRRSHRLLSVKRVVNPYSGHSRAYFFGLRTKPVYKYSQERV